MMTKEQYFTFKSDIKKGMRILSLVKRHRKAYWNEGFATQQEQNDAINKDKEEIKSLKDSIVLRKPDRKWDGNTRKYVETGTSSPIILGDDFTHHWAYYCAKHQLDKDASVEYIKVEKEKMREPWWKTPENIYLEYIEPILEMYEKIVCTD